RNRRIVRSSFATRDLETLDRQSIASSRFSIFSVVGQAVHARTAVGTCGDPGFQRRPLAVAEGRKAWVPTDAVSVVIPIHPGKPRLRYPIAEHLSRVPSSGRDAARKLDVR